jgi:hypothetical protein
MPQCRIIPGTTGREREMFALSAHGLTFPSRARQLLKVGHMKVGHMKLGHMDIGDMDECPWR